jgi:putative ABC transport system permease protein
MNQYEQWDLLVDFKQPLNSTQVEGLVSQVDGVDKYEPYLKMGSTAIISGEDQLISLLCLNTTGTLHLFKVESGRTVENDDEIIVDITISNMLGVELNQIVNLTVGNLTGNFTVVGIVSSPLNVFYLSLTKATEMLGHEMISGLFVKTTIDSDPDAVADSVFALDDVENAMTESQASSGTISEAQGTAITVGMAAMAMALLLAVVWNIVSISTSERTPELAQLEAIGWSRNSLSRLLFLEVLIVSILGIVLSVPVGVFFTSLLDGFMHTYIPFYSPSFDIVILLSVGILTIITAFLATLPAVRRLRKIDIDRVIRARLMT